MLSKCRISKIRINGWLFIKRRLKNIQTTILTLSCIKRSIEVDGSYSEYIIRRFIEWRIMGWMRLSYVECSRRMAVPTMANKKQIICVTVNWGKKNRSQMTCFPESLLRWTSSYISLYISKFVDKRRKNAFVATENQESFRKHDKGDKEVDKKLKKHVTTLCTYIFMINVAFPSRVRLVFLLMPKHSSETPTWTVK